MFKKKNKKKTKLATPILMLLWHIRFYSYSDILQLWLWQAFDLPENNNPKLLISKRNALLVRRDLSSLFNLIRQKLL